MANECNQVILGSSYDKPSQASIQDDLARLTRWILFNAANRYWKIIGTSIGLSMIRDSFDVNFLTRNDDRRMIRVAA